jgi:hypothetical protein
LIINEKKDCAAAQDALYSVYKQRRYGGTGDKTMSMTYTISSKKLGTTIEFLCCDTGGQVYTRDLHNYSSGRWVPASDLDGAPVIAEGIDDFASKCRRYIKSVAKKNPCEDIVCNSLWMENRGPTSAGWDFLAARARLLDKIGQIYARMCEGEEGLLSDVIAAVREEFKDERQYLCNAKMRETQHHEESLSALVALIYRRMRVSIARREENKVRITHMRWSNKLGKCFRFSCPVGGGAITLDHSVGYCIPQVIGQGGMLHGEAIIANDDIDFSKKVRRWYRQHLALAR